MHRNPFSENFLSLVYPSSIYSLWFSNHQRLDGWISNKVGTRDDLMIMSLLLYFLHISRNSSNSKFKFHALKPSHWIFFQWWDFTCQNKLKLIELCSTSLLTLSLQSITTNFSHYVSTSILSLHALKLQHWNFYISIFLYFKFHALKLQHWNFAFPLVYPYFIFSLWFSNYQRLDE